MLTSLLEEEDEYAARLGASVGVRLGKGDGANVGT
jgi:hypothetical protein